MVYMTTIFCKDFGKELWPKPTLTQAITCCSLTWRSDSPVRHGLSPASTPQPGEVLYFEKHRHPCVPDSLDKQSHYCVSSNPTNVCSIFASTGHLSQSWFYMFFSLCWLQTTEWSGAAWWTGVCERRCTQALACANVASCELLVLFHYLNSFN